MGIDMFVGLVILVILFIILLVVFIEWKDRITDELREVEEELDMIKCDMRNGKGMHLQGSISDLSAECILIMRQLYKKNKQEFGAEIAKSLSINMLTKAILLEEGLLMNKSKEEQEAYFD